MNRPNNDPYRSSDLLIKWGARIMISGMLLSLIALTPLITGRSLSSLWWWLAMVTGVGFGMLLIGLRLAARNRSKLIRKHLQGEINE